MSEVEYVINDDRYRHPEDLAAHLGGHEGETHVDEGAANFLIENYKVKSVIDVGCGPGGMVELFKNKGLNVTGVDGDHLVERADSVKDLIKIHDFETGPFTTADTYDLAWSVEFVEHIKKPYMPNFLQLFTRCKYVCMTHALPNQPGHHHVNCMIAEYWFGVMEAINFSVLVEDTNKMRESSTMKERYIRQQGYLFKNNLLEDL